MIFKKVWLVVLLEMDRNDFSNNGRYEEGGARTTTYSFHCLEVS